MKKRHLQMPDVPSEGAASLLIGREVLARRNADGFHYLGTVAERVSDSFFGKINKKSFCKNISKAVNAKLHSHELP